MNVLDTENPAGARTKCLIDNTIIGFMRIINEESTMERNEMKVYVLNSYIIILFVSIVTMLNYI